MIVVVIVVVGFMLGSDEAPSNGSYPSGLVYDDFCSCLLREVEDSPFPSVSRARRSSVCSLGVGLHGVVGALARASRG